MIFAEKNSLVVLAMKGQIRYNIRKGKTVFAEIHERRKQRRMNLLFFLTLKSELVVAREDTNLEKALAQLKDVPYSTIPVIDRKGAYVGTISEGDILWAMQEDPDINFANATKTKLRRIQCRRTYKPVNVNATSDELLQLVITQNFVPVVDDGNVFIGIVKRRDVLNYYLTEQEKKSKKDAKVKAASGQ